jgi:parallel beta-helix repeat protein
VAGAGCTVIGCTAASNTLDGISTGDGCSVRDCTAINNQGEGFRAGAGNTVGASTAFGNIKNGINAAAGTSIRDCASRSNGIDGIALTSDCYLFGNDCTANVRGISFSGQNNRVDSNTCSGNSSAGFSGFGTQNFVIRNTAKGNPTGFAAIYVFTLGAGDEISSVSYGNSWANYQK